MDKDLDLKSGTVVSVNRRRRLTVANVNKMRHEMDADKSPLSIEAAAEKYKIPYFTAYQIRRGWTYKAAGGPILEETQRRKPMSAKLAEKLRALKAKGASIDQLMEASGYGRTAVKKALAGEV